jgi:biopolymer transport protein ExbB
MTAFLPYLHVVEVGTMVLLALLSIWSIGAILERWRVFRSAGDLSGLAEAERLIRAGDGAGLRTRFQEGPSLLSGVVRTLVESPQQPENLDAAVRGYLQKERQVLDRKLGLLATLGSNAPFVGLFGTVLGVIEAFSALSEQQAGSASVMASIAQALIATAAGLFVAIPAVVAFNLFSDRLRRLLQTAESLKNLYLSRLP